MVLLDNGKFLTELHKLYEANKGRTVWVTMKRSKCLVAGTLMRTAGPCERCSERSGRGCRPAAFQGPTAILPRPDQCPQAT